MSVTGNHQWRAARVMFFSVEYRKIVCFCYAIRSMTIHFVCRGNAFRSVIAEAYLKSLRIPHLTVVSSGTVASKHRANNLKKYPRTYKVLERHKVHRYAKSVIAEDTTQQMIDSADLVIFMNDIPHKEAVNLFRLPEKVIVWDVADLGEGDRIATSEEKRDAILEEVFCEIRQYVDELVRSEELKSP